MDENITDNNNPASSEIKSNEEFVINPPKVVGQTELAPVPNLDNTNSNTIVAILLLWLLYPLGLIFMWVKTKWPVWVKILVTLPVVLTIIGLSLAIVLIVNNPSISNSIKKNSSDYAPLIGYGPPPAGSTFWIPSVEPGYFPMKYYELGKTNIIIRTVGLSKAASIDVEGPYADQLKMESDKERFPLKNITIVNPGVFEASLPQGLKSGLYWVVVKSQSGEESKSPGLVNIGSKSNER